jgi:Tfp pilus assembly protein PilF
MSIRNILLSLILTITGGIKAQYTFEQLMTFGLRSDEKGDYVAAILSLDQAIELKPEDDMAWLSRGVVYVHKRDFGSAVVDFNKAILLNPTRTQTYLYRFIAYLETENFQFAYSDINRYLNEVPNDTFARLQRMDLSMKLSEFENFQTDVQWLYHRIGDALFSDYGTQQMQFFEQSKQMLVYAKILATIYVQHPSSKGLKSQYLSALFGSEQYTQCLELVNELLSSDPTNSQWLKYKGDALFYLKQITEAAEIYAQLLKLNPADADLLADYGHCMLQQEKWAEADEWLSKSIKSKNSSPAYAYLGRGIARYNQGKVGLACVDWQRSYQLGEKAAKKWLDAHCEK